MALYPKAVKKLIPPGPTDPRIKARAVILHVAASEAASLYGWFNGPSGGVESHFYIRRDGVVEQYRDTAFQADANMDANDFAISIETQGMAMGEWTPAQLQAIKDLLLWCRQAHGIPLVKCPSWNGSGVGYHTLFPAQWDKRGASCPGPDRIKQFNNVLVPWMTSPVEEDDLPSANEVAEANWHCKIQNTVTGAPVEAQVFMQSINKDVYAIKVALTALARTLPADVQKAVVDALNGGIELVVKPKV